ncbi:type I DNA topoisomerase [Leptolyngbya sp. FACHB-671]|uniref:type I DNA topoisomerase n=1 Tax=Leptolyngbya sp. FACHB-671 TaxID=2692812 RepID=UPI001686EC1A|nr:type I DNA topoisomerase [Leptolyngbya sp. FACHB-671]MBD2068484.1 type I DNA topoisomerase [Leptolyngbya sp. FACHB-671]
MANLLLIESPGKLKKLGQILGPNWIVKASMGHIRELANDGEDALGFDLEGTQIHCRYEPRDARAKKVLAELRQAVKQANAVYIATDPDREGETIGWHLQQELRLKNPRRVVYSEITPAAVQQAIAHPRTLDQALIAAGRARDCLDKLVGYKGSRHVVWQLNNGAKSMGRVQSATLHLLCVREREIQTFKPEDYWSVWVSYREGFKAFYRSKPTAQRRVGQASSQPPAESSDDASTNEDSKPKQESERVTTQAEADRLVAIARSTPHQVVKVEGKVVYQSPPAPFITSTLQQAAGAKLRFSPEKTMKVAQSLYEAGYITYMRTDSVVLAAPFCQAVRQYLEQHDPTNVPQRTAKHRAVKGAQEAHEAIRPTDVNRVPPLAASADEANLYELIWNRAIASQCCPARLQKTRVVTQSGTAFWEARGQVLEFAGYTRYWNNLSADAQLPPLQTGQVLQLQKAQADQKQTQPPPRYSEPKLVQLMERQGIGRPSTYAPTIKTLRERDYVQLLQGKLQPTALGLDLDAALEKLLPDLIQPAFTAQMETALDAIASGQQDWQTYLTSWHRDYFAPAIVKARQAIGSNDFKATHLKATHFKEAQLTPSQQNSSAQPEKSLTKTAQTKTVQTNPAQQVSKVACPSCGELMHKVPSRSKKLKANHFLKCIKPGCATVMFWNSKAKKYELPYSQRTPDPESFTDYPCPVCGALLERYTYTREGQAKVMLRCSLIENRRGKCKDVAFFQGKDGFWSPKFGVLNT